MEYHERKSTRIPGYSYATQNYYFITICSHEKRCIFGKAGELNHLGMIVSEFMEKIPEIFHDVQIDKFVVMPNHVHAIIMLGLGEQEKQLPNLNLIMGQYKSAVSRKIHEIYPGMVVWQRSYHDHIIRGQREYEKIWLYIEGNPKKWEDDCFYVQ